MEPITIIIIFLLVVFIGGIISYFQRSKKLAESPTHKRIDKMDKENFPEISQEYKLEDLSNLRTHWINNGLEFSDPQFQELYKISIQDEINKLNNKRDQFP
jgi:hypothetical protein